jgi:putative SOS response-associated peptidase YedK
MCNRYRMTAKQAELARRFGVEAPYPEDQSFPPDELFPRRMAWVVRVEEGRRVLDVMRWGVPLTVKGPKGPVTKPVTNVRNLTSPFWKSTLARAEYRCLVPVTDFCEWEGETGAKRERWFSVPSRPIFAFAGVWRPGPEGRSFAFLTCEANEIVRPIHAKAMPVILHDEDHEGWLAGDYASVCALAAPYPSQLMAVG